MIVTYFDLFLLLTDFFAFFYLLIGDGSAALYGGLYMLEDDAEEESEVRDVLSSGSIIRPLPRQQPHQPAASMPRQQWYAVEAEYEALQQEASSAAAAIPMPRQHSILGEIG